jgi:hypothetical protein
VKLRYNRRRVSASKAISEEGIISAAWKIWNKGATASQQALFEKLKVELCNRRSRTFLELNLLMALRRFERFAEYTGASIVASSLDVLPPDLNDWGDTDYPHVGYLVDELHGQVLTEWVCRDRERCVRMEAGEQKELLLERLREYDKLALTCIQVRLRWSSDPKPSFRTWCSRRKTAEFVCSQCGSFNSFVGGRTFCSSCAHIACPWPGASEQVTAAYLYDLELFGGLSEQHDAKHRRTNKQVQIRTIHAKQWGWRPIQAVKRLDRKMIGMSGNKPPDHLVVLLFDIWNLERKGLSNHNYYRASKERAAEMYRDRVTEIYNGPGKSAWDAAEREQIELQQQLDVISTAIYEAAGGKFNINSPKQLAEVLFDQLGLPSGGRTAKAGSRSTKAQVLEKLAADYPIANQVIEYRELAKLKGTSVDFLKNGEQPISFSKLKTLMESISPEQRLEKVRDLVRPEIWWAYGSPGRG